MNMLQLHAQQVEAAATAKTPQQRRKAQAAAAQAFVSRMTWPSEASGGKEAAAKKGKPKARRVCPQPTEHTEQVAFVKWFRLQYPGVLIFAIPNGGARNKATAGKLKAEGVTPGVPDLFIPDWRLFVEMKRQKGGQVSPEQKRVMAHLVGCGYRCIVAKGCEDAIKQINRVQTQSQEDDWWARVDAEIENVCAELEGLRDE